MKVLFVAPHMHTNQIPLLSGMVSSGIEVSYYSYYCGTVEEHDVLKPVMIHKGLVDHLFDFLVKKIYPGGKAEGIMMKWCYPNLIWFAKELKRVNPDLVILRDRLPSTIVINFICRILKIKNIVLYDQKSLQYEYPKKEKALLPNVRYTPVKDLSDKASFVQEKHAYYLPLVYETKGSTIRPVGEKVNIIDIGKFRNYKNHTFVLDVVENLIKKSITNFHVTILGQAAAEDEIAYYKKLEKIIGEKNIQDYVTLKSNVPYREMRAIYAQNDILILASKKETYGMVVEEAMGNGLSVCCSSGCGVAHIVQNSKCGYVFDPNNADKLAEQLSYYLKYPEKINECKLRALNYIKKEMSYKAFEEKFRYMCKQEFGLIDKKAKGN